MKKNTFLNACLVAVLIFVSTTSYAQIFYLGETGFETDEEQEGWIIEDRNGDGVTWEYQTGVDYKPDSDPPEKDYDNIVPFCSSNPKQANDDWLFSKPVPMNPGTYKIWFQYGKLAFQCSDAVKGSLACWMGTKNTEATAESMEATGTKIFDKNPVSNCGLGNSEVQDIDSIKIYEGGLYIFAFHDYTEKDQMGVGVDNFKIEIGSTDKPTNTDPGTGVNTTKNDHLVEMYPNPTKNVLNITNTENAKIFVYNVIGEMVQKIDRADVFTSIDFSNLNNGTYIVKVVNNNNVITKKINHIK